MNRVTIANFSGLPEGMAGSLAHEWLASWSLPARMRAQLHTAHLPNLPIHTTLDLIRSCLKRLPQQFRLGWRARPLPSVIRDGRQDLQGQKMQVCSLYPLALRDLLEAGDPHAAAFVFQMGVALAALVATLKLAPPESRLARPEWPETHWQRWQQINDMVLGGGLLSGILGQHLVAAACEWLPRLGVEDVRLHLFPEARQLMLHGAARQYSEGWVLAVDAGHTAIKRALIRLSAGEVVEVRPWPLVPTPYALSEAPELLDVLSQICLEPLLEGVPARQVALSVSAHLDYQGRIARATARGSFYSSLAGIDLSAALDQHLARRLGGSTQICVMHEGQAAVQGLPGMGAALLLGTSVGGAFRA
ncbi:hypothetical protein ACFFLM_06460 [Deinococcus oregonensis]|uniref:Uncharacterized protein n=1 Tax=Deinococcus oregonensis TaxID=1805970 RepID=A0ABV6AVT6_9DEIO